MLGSIPSLARAESVSPPFRMSVMLWTVFQNLPFEQRLEKVAEAGYTGTELVFEFEKWSDADFRHVNAKKRSLKLTFDATAGVKTGAADPRAHGAFLSEVERLLVVAEKMECSAIIVLSGDRVTNVSREVQHKTCVDNLRRAADAAGIRGVKVLIETIDPEENPDIYLSSVTEGAEIVRQANHPNAALLYDFYHEQVASGNLIAKLEKDIDIVGLVHIADVPGRHEPGTGEINYPNIYRKLAELQYGGYVAMEFLPTGDPLKSLESARKMAMGVPHAV